ncbi:hypothetical protein C8J56DRAFT_952720 [Mycena floridula]|nr:hypothetical protein C8J56DRAFT_952720 [Mycena floridula]
MIPTPQSPGLPSQLNLADSISVCIIYSWFYCREFESDALQNLVQSTEPRIVIATYGFDGQEPIRNVNVLWRDLEDEGHFARQWGRREDAQELDMWEEAEEIVKARRVTVCVSLTGHADIGSFSFRFSSITVLITVPRSSRSLHLGHQPHDLELHALRSISTHFARTADHRLVKPGSGAAQGEVIEGAVPSSSSATAGSSALAAPAGTTPSRKSTLSRLGSWMGGSNEKKAATPPSDKKGRFVEDVGSNLKKNGGTPKDT